MGKYTSLDALYFTPVNRDLQSTFDKVLPSWGRCQSCSGCSTKRRDEIKIRPEFIEAGGDNDHEFPFCQLQDRALV